MFSTSQTFSRWQTNEEREAIRESFAVYAPENISLVTIANLWLLPSQSWKLEKSQKVDSSGGFICASKCIKFPLWKVKIQASSSLCARINVFLLMKCLPFPLTKEPLMLLVLSRGWKCIATFTPVDLEIGKSAGWFRPPSQKQNSNSRSNIDTKIFFSPPSS